MELTTKQKIELGLIDGRKDFYFRVENEVVDRSEEVFNNIYEMAVFTVLSRYCNNNRVAFPSIKKIALKCHCSESSVKRAVQGLIDTGLLKRVNRKKKNSNENDTNLYSVQNISAELTHDKVGRVATHVGSHRTDVGSHRTDGVGSVRHSKKNYIKEEQTKKSSSSSTYNFLNNKTIELKNITKTNIKKYIKNLTEEKFLEYYNWTLKQNPQSIDQYLYKALKENWDITKPIVPTKEELINSKRKAKADIEHQAYLEREKNKIEKTETNIDPVLEKINSISIILGKKKKMNLFNELLNLKTLEELENFESKNNLNLV